MREQARNVLFRRLKSPVHRRVQAMLRACPWRWWELHLQHFLQLADLAEEEQLNMEEVLGGKVRKAPESETTTPEPAPDMDVAKAT